MGFIHKKKRKWGDRRDGVRVRDINGINVIMAGLYPNRTDCEVCLRDELDITELLKFIEKKNASGQPHETKLFHCIVAMLVRILNERRALNRFVRGCRIYERDEILISFIVKRMFNDKADETLLTYKAKANDNIDDVSRFILGEVDDIRVHTDKRTGKASKGAKKDVSSTINAVASLPRPLVMLITGMARFLDFFGKVPNFLTEGDPAYTTVLLANLGSIKCPAVYHHLNNYGTNSIVMTIGAMKKKTMENEDGSKEVRDILDIAVTADERIADGFYFAKSIKILHFLCAHPEILEKKFKEDVKLIFD